MKRNSKLVAKFKPGQRVCHVTKGINGEVVIIDPPSPEEVMAVEMRYAVLWDGDKRADAEVYESELQALP